MIKADQRCLPISVGWRTDLAGQRKLKPMSMQRKKIKVSTSQKLGDSKTGGTKYHRRWRRGKGLKIRGVAESLYKHHTTSLPPT